LDVAGVFAALTTPYAEDGAVSLDQFRANLGLYNRTGLRGYVVLGSTGESVLVSKEEAEFLLAAGREAASTEKLLIAGTGAESTAETIAKTKRAAAHGYAAALVKTPHYYKPAYGPEVFLRHYRSVADGSPIPVLLYSVPVFTGVSLETQEVLALAEHPNIAGIKDSSGVIQRIVEVAAGAPKGFAVLTGGAGVVYPALCAGARGAVLALASALPEKCVALYDLWKGGRHLEAQALQQELAAASKTIVSESGIAGLKYAMGLRGYAGGPPRLPLLPLREESKRRIEGLLSRLEPAAATA